MVEEIAALVAALSSEDWPDKLRSDASASMLRLGFQSLYSILRQSVRPVESSDGGDDAEAGSKLGLEVWDQTRIHALACVSIAVAKGIRSLSVEQLEPVAVAVVQQSIEFALCYLEKWIGKSDDSSIQSTMLQLLELLLIDGVHKELELSGSCPVSIPVDLLPTVADKDALLWHDNIKCMVQGSMCCQENEADDHLLIPLISQRVQVDIINPVGQSFSSNANKLSTISKHWAIIHLRCNHRLISLCREILEHPLSSDERQSNLNLRRKLSTCLRILKLLASVAKTHSFFYSDKLLLDSAASFIDALPSLLRSGVEFANSNSVVESSYEGLATHILEEFLQVMQATFCNNFVFQNIQACVVASILHSLGSDVWRFNKYNPSSKIPLAYFPRVVTFALKLISNIKDQANNSFELDDLSEGLTDPSDVDSPSCDVCNGKVFLLKKLTVEELFGMLFPSSVQWLGSLMHLVTFLHSKGIKLKPVLERSYSSGTKTSVTSDVESVVCHEDEALFGDLFSEGGRSVGAADACEQSSATANSISSLGNMPFQATIELLSFLRTCVFSPQWHPSMYQDARKKLNDIHIDSLLSILNSQSYYSEDRTCDNNSILHEDKKFGHVHLFCFELLQKLVMLRALSESLEESVVDKILIVENGAYRHNDHMLALLAQILICRVGSTGSRLRSKIYQMFATFIHQKVETICTVTPSLKETVEALPSLFHIEILLIAFHLSSEEEKAERANEILSSIKTIGIHSAVSDTVQLSCWTLVISRLVLVLRHMIYHPRSCPSLLLVDFRSKLKAASKSCMPDCASYLSSWPAIALEDIITSSGTPTNTILLNQLIDISSLPASLCRDFLSVDCLHLNWEDISATFSQILRFWNGKRAANIDDLILERYLFVLCWDVPVEGSSEHLKSISSCLKVPNALDMNNFLHISHSILTPSYGNEFSSIPDVLWSWLQQLHESLMREDICELSWDFFRCGSSLSFVLSLLCIGIQEYNIGNLLPTVNNSHTDFTARDTEFLGLTKTLVCNFFTADQVAVLIKLLSTLLKRYIWIYQRALASILKKGHHSADKIFPLLLLEFADLDNTIPDELSEKMGIKPSLLGSIYELPLRLSKIVEKFALGVRSKVFWEFVLHGFPLHLQPDGEVLSSCILNMKGIVVILGGLLEIIVSRGISWEDKVVIGDILESVLSMKSDKVFGSLKGECEHVCHTLKMDSDGPDYSLILILKRMGEFLSINVAKDVDRSIHEYVVVKMVDMVESLKGDPLKSDILKIFLTVEDIPEMIKNFCDFQPGDILVLIDALDYCLSESVNVKVLNFFTVLLSGDYPEVKEKLEMKFVSMDLVSLSKWLEMRLLGSSSEPPNGASSAGTSASLRDSTMNFLTCLLMSNSEHQLPELQSHVHQAMLLSLDDAFSLFDIATSKGFFNFIVQLSKGELLISSLLQRTTILMEKLAEDQRLLQGLKYLLGFLTTILSDCGSLRCTVEKSYGKTLSTCSSSLGALSSRILGSRKNADDLIPSTNRGSASVDCDATSVDDDEDDGTSDGELGSIYKDEEEDSNTERALAAKVCTFTSSGSNFMEQHWYFCYTCDLTVSKGCCSVCAKVCHRGHRVVYSRSSRFFCDCGAGGVRGSSCQCLKPRKYTGSNTAPARSGGNFQSFLSLPENSDQIPDSDSDVDEDLSLDLDCSCRLSLPMEVQEKMSLLLDELDVEGRILRVCSLLLPYTTNSRDSNTMKDGKVTLAEDKVLHYSNDLLQLKKAYKSGSLDLKIKADYSNAKELKSHLTSGSLVKSLLSVSGRGRLAVGEGDKVAIFDVGQLIGQATIAPVTADKANVKPLSKNVVRFEIVHLLFNSLVENYLVVAGYEDCQVLTVNHRGEVIDRLAIELALQGAYIRRVEWVPGSQVQLMVATNKFVKIYDLSQDNISPLHYVTLSDDTIVDATLLMASHSRMLLIVLSDSGSLYRLELSVKVNVGCRPLKEIIHVEGRNKPAKGSSLYFSSSHKLLFLSYQDGSTIFGRLNPDATAVVEVSAVYENDTDGNHRPAGLHRWKELLGGSGLFVCYSNLKSNGILAISLGQHDVFAQNLRHTGGSTSPLVGVTAYRPLSKDKTHCLILHEDGSLQIYSHIPAGVENGVNLMADKVKKLGSGILKNKAYGGVKPEFPLDFFEKTVCITQDVKFTGEAIRNNDSEGAKQTLASEDGFLEGPNPTGFKITVTNSNPDIVIVGFRMHVGNTSASHIPSEITIFQRVIKLDEGMRSWYDVPFTVAESLLADEEFTISIGRTFGGSALPRIDTLEVYGRAKDEFGWKEKMDAILDMEARVPGCSSWSTGSTRKSQAAQSATVQEQVVADGLKLLSWIYLLRKPQESSKTEDFKVEWSNLKCKQVLETIFESDREPLLQAAASRVLQAVFPRKDIYYQVKDNMHLCGVVKSTVTLSSKLGMGELTSGWIIEEFTAQMRAVSKIALHRRSNLASFLESNGSEVVDGLMQLLWGILDIEQPDTQTMNNIVISSVELIYCYAECLTMHEKDAGMQSVGPAVALLKQLIFSSNEAIQTASSLAISSRLLQVPFPKQTMIGADDVTESATSVALRTDSASVTSGNNPIMVEEDSITSSVQYCCDGCSTVPILRRRWHCTVCPDFDLCEACYEVLDAESLPPPHSRDHPMTAIPIEVETFSGDGNEIHLSTDDISETTLLPGAADVSLPNSAPSIHELEPNDSGEFSPSSIDPVTISASKRAVNSLLLSELLEQLKGWTETTSGVQAIPLMQLFYRLSSAIGGPFVDSSEAESLNLEKLIKWFVDEMKISKPSAARNRSSFGEVMILIFMFFTLMLRNWNQPGVDVAVSKSGGSTDAQEKATIQILPSVSSASDGLEKSDSSSCLHRACGFLRQQAFVNYLMDILQQLVHVFKAPSVSAETQGLNPGSGCGALLTVRRELPAGNFSPFFSDSYAKSHRSDIFADYHRLLLENTFRLVYCLIRPEKHDKGGEKEKTYKILTCKDLKLDGYQDVLCSYINNPHTSFVRRYARRLFLHLCGSKTHYYSVRDTWQFSTEMKKLYKHINKSGGFQSSISYERSVKIVKSLTTIAEVSAARPRNWQKYCLRHGDVLPFLMNGVFSFGEECVIQALKLLNLAFYTGKDTNHSSQKAEGGEGGTSSTKFGTQSLESKKKKKGEEGSESPIEKSYMDMEQALNVFTDRGDDCLKQFIDTFLLEWNFSSVRGEAKFVLLGAWHHGKQMFKETMLTDLLQKVNHLPLYGQNVIEYTELLTGLLGKSSDSSLKLQHNEIIDKCLTSDVIRCIFETLHSQNELLANHPNSRIYNTLSGLVEFDGYYLESEPCVACSSPEVPYSRMKLESLKSETKFTDNRIIVKCTGSYTIQSVTMNVHDARKSKSVKVLNLYYNNRPVADLSELKNNWSLWKRAKICHLAFNQTELKVDFPIPITACNFMIELDSFYENLQALSLEPLQCPRCSRPVTDKHGICGNCHENAYQCRQCRNINYENLDSFLCNECGYSKYGRFEFNFMAKPSFTFDSMENDEDLKRGLAAIESESENAHRRYQQLLGFKKPLLKIVSSIGENEMDSQQKDSVQQMMVSLPGPSCKINRKIALLGVLYGEKCKAAFDSVSKSVQTLQGLRRVLMNYLHQKHSDNLAAASRFVVLRSPNSCYGCASTFVAQCLEILLVLSKHVSSKKQLVASGILRELFENNIHQGPKTARVQARAALCAFSEADVNAVAELNSLLLKKVVYCLEHHRSIDIALATREELMLLSDVCSLADEFWESRLRIVFQLLFKSIKLGAKHPAISEHVILPCLKIISHACTPPKPDAVDKEPVNGKPAPAPAPHLKDENNSYDPGSSGVVNANRSESLEKNWDGSSRTQDIQLLSYSEWERGASYLDFVRRQYKVSQAVRVGHKSRPQRYDYLAMKYGLRWKRRACKTAQSEIKLFELGSWVTELILSACSQSIRTEMCMLVNVLCGKSSSRRFRLLNLLMSLLPATLPAGENAAEYFELLFRMIESEEARVFLTVRGCLTTICKLITREVNNVESLERSLHIDISQGFIFHKLIELLGKFLEVPNIRSRFMREQLLSDVLEALIVIRGLVVQKTKLISDCNKLLKDLLDSLLLESNENKRQFIQACIGGLQTHGEDRKGRSSMFILEQLCNLICPMKPEPTYLLILNKAHTQEEFIRGSMTKNPYSSAEIGPLMRDVKNKICHQLDLLGLLEDDYGMELLVAGNIISLDLSVSQVYEQVWKKSNSQTSTPAAGTAFLSVNSASSTRDCPPMIVTYRLQGLDGEATEPMIKEVDEDREESQDPEIEFAITGAVCECGGLEILLSMVQRLREDLKSNQEQLVAVLNLLMLCCKTRENRRTLLSLGALGLLLETARRAFSVDAMEPAEGILLIVESLTLEANENDNISVTPGALTVSNEDAGSSEQAKKIVLMFLERLSQPSGLKKSSKQQRNTEMVARILPYLTYGEPVAMEVLIQHFDPYLQNWSEFDQLQKQYEDNPKDDKIAQLAAKQKFALENFVRVSESLKTSSCGERLKDIILEKGITRVAVRHLKDCFSCTAQLGYKSTAEWASGLKLPSVPLVLSMLRGLSMGHLATQKCIDEEGILPLLHALESVPGENEVGPKAENLLDTLTDKEGTENGFLAEKVQQLRHATRDEMRRRALKKREELLQGLGMRQEMTSDGGERIIVSQPVLEGFEDFEDEEDGLACMVCREGYKLRPTDMLGVYTYSKRVNLGVGSSGSARGDCVYTTVSHFNIIHFQCHQEAKRADAALKNPKKEWDGAALRNNETLCNNLFPLRGPSVPMGQYRRYVDQYWDHLNALGRADGSRLRLLTYDVVLMLARFATGASFSADSRGGGKESNSKYLPFMIQMARHLLDQDASQRSNLSKSIASYLSSPTQESKNSTSPGAQPSSGTEETVQFMMVSSLLSESYESWLQHRRAFLQRGIYHAYMQRNGRSMQRSTGSSSSTEELFSTIQPMLVYTGLIEQLQHYFKVKKPAGGELAVSSSEGDDESKKLEGWELVMREKLLNVKDMVSFSKELLTWLDEMTSSSDLQESFDIIGALSDVLGSEYSTCQEFVNACINSGKT